MFCEFATCHKIVVSAKTVYRLKIVCEFGPWIVNNLSHGHCSTVIVPPGGCEIVKLHFGSNPTWRTVPKIGYIAISITRGLFDFAQIWYVDAIWVHGGRAVMVINISYKIEIKSL